MKRRLFLGVVLFLFPLLLVAADAKKDYVLTDFFRVTKPEGKKTPTSYDTAIAKFAGENNVEVDLIGAIHIGDKEYYAELNKIFRQYDVVLYELVAEENAKPVPQASGERSILSSFQSSMGSILALEHQLQHVDYHAENLVHADLSPSEFAQRISDRGDIFQTLFRAIILGVKKSGSEGQKDELKMQGRFLGSLFAADPSLSWKRVVAEEMMSQMDDATWVIGGEDGSAIITDRNAAALKVLRQELNKGKKKIAIFYGAAHLPEFARSLEKDFKMKYTGSDWVIAWDLTKDQSARK